MKLVRIIRVKPAGTGSGGSGTIKAVPGVIHGTRDDTVGDAQAPAVLRAYANMRERAANAIRRSPIGSKGNL